MNKLLLVVVLMLGASISVTGCNKQNEQPKQETKGTSPNDKTKQDDKNKADEKARNEIAALTKVIRDLDSPPETRAEAIRSVGKMGSSGKTAVPAIIEVLKTSQRVDLRSAAVEALGEIGPDAKEATLPVLIEMCLFSGPPLPNRPGICKILGS